MIIIKLMGGLGNQMFQYAFGKSLAIKNNIELKLDTSFLLDRTPHKKHFVFRDYDLSIFNVDAIFATEKEVKELTQRTSSPFVDRILNQSIGFKKSYIKDMGLVFNSTHLTIKDNAYLEGYWQSEKYFSEISLDLKQFFFTYRSLLETKAKTLINRINGVNAVCVNVRRGDFVINSFHGTMGVDYYMKAEKMLLEKYEGLEFFVFSDDIDWCKENLHFKSLTTFVGHEYAGHKFQDYLRLMSACKHFIIPNSSFAWWAVWLSTYSNKMIIAPKNWINNPPNSVDDLIPKDWIRI